MRLELTTSLAALCAVMSAGPALAQEPEWTAQGTLEDGDRQDGQQRRYDEHRLRLEAGRRYRLTAEAADFDTVLELIAPGGSEPIAGNDDSAGSLNSRITFTPEAGGEYTLRVLGFSDESRGAYRLTAGPVPPLPPPNGAPGTPVSASGTWLLWQGELASDDGEAGANSSAFDDYLVRFEAGQRRFIMLDSDAFDPVLQILTVDGRDADPLEPIDGDDDTGVGTNSLLAFAPDASGEYIIRVTAFGGGTGGAYRLWLSQ